MSAHDNDLNAGTFNTQAFDCGDGVPALVVASGGNSVGYDSGSAGTTPIAEPKISIRVFALTASILTQILIGIIVALGGNAIVGVFAAITVLTCSLILVIAEALNTD